ncbi:unannotated protein [freshwater metagenome]|uniref:Unannotated protein n=1 Tax=freshwater metagenome TaxID=449393 RepID=A0A6J7RXX4_9ZZZZ
MAFGHGSHRLVNNASGGSGADQVMLGERLVIETNPFCHVLLLVVVRDQGDVHRKLLCVNSHYTSFAGLC